MKFRRIKSRGMPYLMVATALFLVQLVLVPVIRGQISDIRGSWKNRYAVYEQFKTDSRHEEFLKDRLLDGTMEGYRGWMRFYQVAVALVYVIFSGTGIWCIGRFVRIYRAELRTARNGGATPAAGR
jgi:hypothetical protein